MDKGEFIKAGYSVEPGENGSWIAVEGGSRFRKDGLLSTWRGFSNYADLIEWLTEEHRVNNQRDAAGYPLPDAMRTGDEWKDLREA